VGAGLFANEVGQSPYVCLTHRIREQARSHNGSSLPAPMWRSAAHQCARYVPSWCTVNPGNRSGTTFPCLCPTGHSPCKTPFS